MGNASSGGDLRFGDSDVSEDLDLFDKRFEDLEVEQDGCTLAVLREDDGLAGLLHLFNELRSSLLRHAPPVGQRLRILLSANLRAQRLDALANLFRRAIAAEPSREQGDGVGVERDALVGRAFGEEGVQGARHAEPELAAVVAERGGLGQGDALLGVVLECEIERSLEFCERLVRRVGEAGEPGELGAEGDVLLVLFDPEDAEAVGGALQRGGSSTRLPEMRLPRAAAAPGTPWPSRFRSGSSGVAAFPGGAAERGFRACG